jgi:VanZ family protein
VKTREQPPCHAPATRHARRINFILWLSFTAWVITVFILSSIPGSRFSPPPFSWADKAVHASIFATGAFLLFAACCRTFGTTSWKAVFLLFAAMVLIGIGDEFHQTFTPGRSGNDRGDLTADAIGALLGICCARLLNGKRRSKPDPAAPLGDRAA